MKIAYNAVLSYDKPRGVGVYFNNLIKYISKHDDINEYYIFYGCWMKYDFTLLKKDNIHLIPLKIPNNIISRNLFLLLKFPFLLKKYSIDILHNIDSTPLMFKTTKVIISTIHDLAEFSYPEKYGRFRAFCRRRYVKQEIKKSDYIITVSNYSKNDIVRRKFKESDKIKVVYNMNTMEVTEKQDNKDDFFLFVGAIERTKNIEVILNAITYLKNNKSEDVKLKIVGKKLNDYNRLIKKIRKNKIEENVEFLDYVSDQDLRSLYSSCLALIFPSLFEGFGLPIIEAQCKKTLVISSTASCLSEVGGEGAIYFNPNDYKSLADIMESLVLKKVDIQHFINEGLNNLKRFDPDAIALQTLDVYNDAYNGVKNDKSFSANEYL